MISVAGRAPDDNPLKLRNVSLNISDVGRLLAKQTRSDVEICAGLFFYNFRVTLWLQRFKMYSLDT